MAFPPDRVADQKLRPKHFLKSDCTPHWMVAANFPHKNGGTQTVQIATSVTLAKSRPQPRSYGCVAVHAGVSRQVQSHCQV